MNKNEIIKALKSENFADYYKLADEIRKEKMGDIVHVRAILEFSNYCNKSCKYCGLNAKNPKVTRYRMTYEEIIKAVHQAFLAGYKTIVLQSGEDPYFTPKILGEIVKEIKKDDIKITLSCGEMSFEEYKYLRECGADKYLLKHETSDPENYAFLHPNCTIETRVNCLKNLKKLGYETGSGFMIGLPNQTIESIADDILLLKEIGCDMAGIGPFISHPDTPLKGSENGSTELTKRAVALARIVMGKIHLPATTSLGVLNQGEKNDIFSCGANVIMKKITPNEYKHFYEIYPAKLGETDIEKDRKILEEQIRELGRTPL